MVVPLSASKQGHDGGRSITDITIGECVRRIGEVIRQSVQQHRQRAIGQE
jgi:hypothetical protein